MSNPLPRLEEGAAEEEEEMVLHVLELLEVLHLLLPMVTAKHHGKHLFNLLVILSSNTYAAAIDRMNEIYIEVAQVVFHFLLHAVNYTLTY